MDQAFKKARRQHIKTTKNRNCDVDATWTPFRAAEKKYKARFPPPDLSTVLDLAIDSGACRTRATRIGTSSEGTGVFTVDAVPGLVLLPSFICPLLQHTLVQWALRDHARHPNEINLDAHYFLPPEGLWNAHLSSLSTDAQVPLIIPKAPECATGTTSASPASGPRVLIANDAANATNLGTLQALPKPPPDPSPTVPESTPSDLVPKLRWANIGWSYHWGTKQYDFSKGKGHVDRRVRDLCRHAVSSVPWERVFGEAEGDGTRRGEWGDDDWRSWDETYEPDAGIVNFYQIKDTLMAHVDRSEVCATSPLVSISLGNAAIFLIGGLTRDFEPVPILLRSGDVVIMSGPACRRAYHGVPRILENTLPDHFYHPLDEPSCTQPAESKGVVECQCKDSHRQAVTSASPSRPDDDKIALKEKAWEPYSLYLKDSRININVRQVFPKGFDVPMAAQHCNG